MPNERKVEITEDDGKKSTIQTDKKVADRLHRAARKGDKAFVEFKPKHLKIEDDEGKTLYEGEPKRGD